MTRWLVAVVVVLGLVVRAQATVPCDEPSWAQNGPSMALRCGWCPPVCPVDSPGIAQTCGEACRASCSQQCVCDPPPCPDPSVTLVQTVTPVGPHSRCKAVKGNPQLLVCRGRVLVKTDAATVDEPTP